MSTLRQYQELQQMSHEKAFENSDCQQFTVTEICRVKAFLRHFFFFLKPQVEEKHT